MMVKSGSSGGADSSEYQMIVDINILNWTYFQIGTAYQPIKDGSRSEWNSAVLYYEKSIKILEPYRVLLTKLDFNAKGCKNTKNVDLNADFDCLSYRKHGLKSPLITAENFDTILEALSKTEDSLGGCNAALGNFESANDFYTRAILHARKYNGDKTKKLGMLCQALMNMGGLFNAQNNPTDAMIYIKEAVAIKMAKE
jgi:tetratricopeptide (TPR) repeat protein